MEFSITRAVKFMKLLHHLQNHAVIKNIDIMGTELQRFIDRQIKLVNEGKSWTTQSDHLVCSAIDIDVVEDGRIVEDGDHPSYKELGRYWEKLDPGCYWGGGWRQKDSRHFGYRPLTAA